jgi:hypothetical protein
MLSTTLSLQLINKNFTKTKATTAAQPLVKRESDYFKANIGNIKSSKALVGNYRLFSYAMKAYGLGDMVYAKAFMQKLMDGGLASGSLVSKMSDARFTAFVKAFDFGDKGASTTSDSTINAATADSYLQQTIEDQAGESNPGVQLALYFQRKAPSITSGMEILADKALLEFTRTLLNVPSLGSSTNIDATAKFIESKIKIADLSDPAKLQKLMTRFGVMYDMQNTSTSSSNPTLSLFTGSTSSSNTTLNTDFMLRVQQLYSKY